MEEDLYGDLKNNGAEDDNNELLVEEEEEESDDSDVEIVLDQVERVVGMTKSSSSVAASGGLVSIKASGSDRSKETTSSAAVVMKPSAKAPASSASSSSMGAKLDLTEIGQYQGKDIIDVDLETEFQDKPWRRPGADITDYFNYNFDESSWKVYCQKQRALREQFSHMRSNRTTAIDYGGSRGTRESWTDYRGTESWVPESSNHPRNNAYRTDDGNNRDYWTQNQRDRRRSRSPQGRYY